MYELQERATILRIGTLDECFETMVNIFGNANIRDLQLKGIRIVRVD